MKIALLGYGKMGKEIEKIAIERGHEIALKIDINNIQERTAENLKKTDVAIDFSAPSSAYDNIKVCFEANIPVVCGTTGWLNKYDEVIHECNTNQKGFFYASNYSVGVNIFFALNKYLANIMQNFKEYNPAMEEVHHTEKLDAPSGTAISLAEDLIDKHAGKSSWELDATDDSKEVLNITAKREPNVPGIHTIEYDSEIDYIRIKHSAKNRKGFATGAVLAAEFLNGKTGVYGMNDLLKLG